MKFSTQISQQMLNIQAWIISIVSIYERKVFKDILYYNHQIIQP